MNDCFLCPGRARGTGTSRRTWLSIGTLLALLGLALLWPLPSAWAATPKDSAGADIRLQVDLRQAALRQFSIQQTLAVKPGPLTLYYPEQVPGEFSSRGPIANVAGLEIRANGRKLAWRRDLHDMYALHLDVPAGATRLELEFQFLPPRRSGRFGSGPSTGSDLAMLEFNQVLFYPAGRPVDQITVQPSVTLPPHWHWAGALDLLAQDGDTLRFRPLPLDQLVDSPLLCGERQHTVALGRPGGAEVRLNIVGEKGVEIEPDDEQIEALGALGAQTLALFGRPQYRHYDFLLVLSDHIGHFSLEHRESSDNRLPADFLVNPTLFRVLTPLLVHEWVHSWNGLYRYPAGLRAEDYNRPIQTDLMWVYEGLTDYLSAVVSTRAGLWTPAYFRATLASNQYLMAHRSGRRWRNLQDTADAARLVWDGSRGWNNWRRRADYYSEGQLLWLDVDTRIRELSDNRRSLDDFVRLFFGASATVDVKRSFDFDDIVQALNEVQAEDWAGFLRQRLDYTGDKLPYHGLERAGWTLALQAQPNERDLDLQDLGYGMNLADSLGLDVSADGQLLDVQWKGSASAAGLIPGMHIVAVNDRDFSLDQLSRALREAPAGRGRIKLLVRNQDLYRSLELDARKGLRHPHLKRAGKHADLLETIIKPRQPDPANPGESP